MTAFAVRNSKFKVRISLARFIHKILSSDWAMSSYHAEKKSITVEERHQPVETRDFVRCEVVTTRISNLPRGVCLSAVCGRSSVVAVASSRSIDHQQRVGRHLFAKPEACLSRVFAVKVLKLLS